MSYLESSSLILSVVAPLVAVPLTMITFYLRALREHQISRHTDLARKVNALETATVTLRQAIADFQRDYTTKEEWLRECIMARNTLQKISEKTTRIEATLQPKRTPAAPDYK